MTQEAFVLLRHVHTFTVDVMSPTASIFSGLAFGLSLIVPIGPQNLFVLRKGLIKQHVGTVVAICVISDALLIAAGAGGVGALVSEEDWLTRVIRFGGAIFLGSYAALNIWRASRSQGVDFSDTDAAPSLKATVLTCLAFTWLNPHVYLDTVVLLGAVANSPGRDPVWFASGAILASLFWFSGLGYGARYLRGILLRSTTNRILDVAIALVMLAVGVSLLMDALG